MFKQFAAISTLALALTGVASAQGVPFDNFEGYADQTAFAASWNQDVANVTFMTDGGNSGNNYVRTPGGTGSLPNPTGRFSKAINLTPSDANPVVASFWIRLASTSQGRSYLQLESAGATSLVNFGVFNSPAGANWFVRTLGGGAPGTWTGNGPNRAANTWTNLKAVVKGLDVEYYVNDVLIVTQSRTSAFPALVQARFGFSAGGSAINVDYDDIHVYQAIASVNDWAVY